VRSSAKVVANLKEAYSGPSVEMNKGISNLGALLKAKNEDNAPARSDSETDDHADGSERGPEETASAGKRKKNYDGVILSKDNTDILN